MFLLTLKNTEAEFALSPQTEKHVPPRLIMFTSDFSDWPRDANLTLIVKKDSLSSLVLPSMVQLLPKLPVMSSIGSMIPSQKTVKGRD